MHFVRTCQTVCKYDPVPPQCPPGYCADAECLRCKEEAFSTVSIDILASKEPPDDATQAPVSTGDDGSECKGGGRSSFLFDRNCK